MKAYHVWDNVSFSDEQNHEIIFADTSGKAKYHSDAYGMSGEFMDIKAKRIPEFDQYAEQGYVPKEVMVKHGWRFECDKCYSWVGEEGYVTNEMIYCADCYTSKVSSGEIK